MSIEFSTSEYEFSHGKQPRGYGQWGFFFDNDDEPYWFNGSYANAKKSARAFAVSKGYHLIRVAP